MSSQRLHGRVVGATRLDDGATPGTGPADRLHPGGQGPLPGSQAGTPLRHVGVDHRHKIQPAGAQISDVVGPADEYLAVKRKSRRVARPETPHLDIRRAGRPFLNPLSASSTQAEVRRSTRRAAPDRLAHGAPEGPLLRAERAAALGAGCRRPAGSADGGSPVARHRREDEAPPCLSQSSEEPRRPALGAGLNDLDRWPPARNGVDLWQRKCRRLRGGADRLEDASPFTQSRSLQRNVPHVVVGRPVLAVCRMRLA